MYKDMELNKDNTNLSRKNFLRICGSVIAGGSILGVSGVLLRDRYNRKPLPATGSMQPALDTPYKLVSSFSVPDRIESFEITDDRLIVAIPQTILLYDPSGSLLNTFSVGSTIRDIAVDDSQIYLLYPTRIEVYDKEGARLREWEACSEASDYCSFTVTPEAVFVTDAANKNICKYAKDGSFERFIQSPNGFIIPSYTFGITCIDDVIYCSNSGRHLIESYTPGGEYIGAFGKAGGATGMFCGCCNPVHLTYTPAGEIITSEKGNPRISCYSRDGEFRNVLLDAKALGGGNTAYDVKVYQDKLFVAGNDRVSTFRYDKTLAAATACSACKANCPLREGVYI